MTKQKFRICVILLAFSLVLTLGTIRLLSDPDRSDETNPSGGDLNESQNTGSEIIPVSTVDIPTALTEPSMEQTTDPTTQPTTEEATVPETTEQDLGDVGMVAAKTAVKQLGKPYQYGTAGPDSFDTSGLLQYCFQQAGVSIPRSNSAQAEYGYVVDKEDIAPGDAVFFWSSNPGIPEYPGIYVGNGMVIAAMNSSKPVVQFDMNSSYYTEHFVFVRRFY